MIVTKKDLIQKPVAKETKVLAQSLYSTYLSNGCDPYIFEPVNKFYDLFGFSDKDASLNRLLTIFMDLTEPILLEYFEFNTKRYSNLILTFCNYKILHHMHQIYLEIEIDERYLEALKSYVLDPYLKVS